MRMKHVRQAGRDTHVMGYVLLAILIAVFVLPHFWNYVCTPVWVLMQR